jgi:hypothetical protein
MITPAYSPTATERVLPRMALDFTTGVLDSRVTITRALNTATRVNSSGFVEIVNANLPRFDYDPATLAPKGLLIEEQRTNLVTYSQQFDDASWNKGVSGSISANTVVSPDGTTNADAYTWATSTTDFAFLSQTATATSNIANTFSVWLKRPSGSGNRTVRLTVSDVTTSTGVSATFTVTENWQRFEFTRTSATSTGSVGVGLNTGLSGTSIAAGDILHVWGAQLEAGAFATSYIPTTTTSVTRNADVVSMTGTNFSDWYNQTEGSFVFQYSRYQNTDAFGIVLETKPSSTSTANRFGAAATSTADPRFQLVPNGTSILDTGGTFGVLPVNTVVKGAFAYRSGDSAATRNGASPSNSATAFATPTYTNLQIGGTDNGLYGPPTTSQLNGHIRSIRYYPQRIINAEVQSFSK